MKNLFALFAFFAALTCAAQDLPTEIKLTNGFIMKGCTIVRWETDSITVSYVGGIVPVRFENIDPAQRAAIESHKEAALKKQLSADRKKEKALERVEHKQDARERHEAKRQEEIDRKDAAIQQGLEQHQLVTGMTMDQVRSIFGPPAQSSSLTDVNGSDWWIYAGRGKDGNGVPTNLQVHFRAGGVVRWNNTQR